MPSQINFLLHQAFLQIENHNFHGASIFLNQLLRIQPNHSEALRLSGVIMAQQEDYDGALKMINRAIDSNKKNGIAYSNKGNILLNLGLNNEAIKYYKKSIEISPAYAEAYGNLGNALQNNLDYESAVYYQEKAVIIDPRNPMLICNLGNLYWNQNKFDLAIKAYNQVLQINPNHADANFYLGQIQLLLGDFKLGWQGYEWRWSVPENMSKPLKTKKPTWYGNPFSGRLFVWAEQGVGDQILHASLLNNLQNFPQKIIVSIDKKLLPIFKRSFPDYHFYDKNIPPEESEYDQQIPLASLGQYFRSDLKDFESLSYPYLFDDEHQTMIFESKNHAPSKVVCGIAWSSSNSKIGNHKSITLEGLSDILSMPNMRFINLQNGETEQEIKNLKDGLGVQIENFDGVNLYEDMDQVLSLVQACDIVITTSNSTAHMAGALGKETLLLLPFSQGKFWYWHDLNGSSLWYPSIRVFKQEKQGEWAGPVNDIRRYLEMRIAA